MNYTLFDGQFHQKLKPLTWTKPVSKIRVGITTIKEKWENYFGEEFCIRTKDYLSNKFNSNAEQSIIGICAALLPNSEIVSAIHDLEDNTIMIHDNKVLAIKPLPPENVEFDKVLSSYNKVTYLGDYNIVDRPMDVFLLNESEIQNDLQFLGIDELKKSSYGINNSLIGGQIYIEDGAKIQGASLNSDTGPIYIGKDAEIMEGSIVRGPLAMCENSVLKMGAKIYGATTLGPYCKVGGEVNNSVLLGYSNKGHDGFLGNSVLGEWCNLGADTNISNLKNNYVEVKLWNYPSECFVNTGLQFCGLIMGDHSKCGINTMFNTGTVVGVSANVFGAGFPRNFVSSFSWGGSAGYMTYRLNKVFEVAEKVMQRRATEFNQVEKDILTEVFELTKSYRKN